MSMDQDAVDIGPFAAEIFSDLYAELEARFPELSALDPEYKSAVASAIIKAAWRGLLRGQALLAHEVNRRAPEVDVQPWFNLAGEPDHWAERYGEES